MRFQALSVGAEVPTHCFSGTVHSVFRQACNLWLEPGVLLTLLSSEKGNVPCGIRLNTPPQSVLQDLFRVGQPVACRGGILRIDGFDFSVDLRPAHPWHIDLKELQIDLCRPNQAQSWAVAWSELTKHYQYLGAFFLSEGRPATPAVSEILLQQGAYTIPSLLRATDRLQLRETMISIRSLIGLGYGLTPSGDDFLVGYLAGLWATTGDSPSRTQFLAALDAEISEAARSTNKISRAYLLSAAKGHVSEAIAMLAQQLNQADSISNVRAATQAALQVGHTSGADGVLGLLLGCLAWQSPAPHLLTPSSFIDRFIRHEMRHGPQADGSSLRVALTLYTMLCSIWGHRSHQRIAAWPGRPK